MKIYCIKNYILIYRQLLLFLKSVFNVAIHWLTLETVSLNLKSSSPKRTWTPPPKFNLTIFRILIMNLPSYFTG